MQGKQPHWESARHARFSPAQSRLSSEFIVRIPRRLDVPMYIAGALKSLN
jgi:hypothetical protein